MPGEAASEPSHKADEMPHMKHAVAIPSSAGHRQLFLNFVKDPMSFFGWSLNVRVTSWLCELLRRIPQTNTFHSTRFFTKKN